MVAHRSTSGRLRFFLSITFALSVSILSTLSLGLNIRDYTWVTVALGTLALLDAIGILSSTSCYICSWKKCWPLNVLIIPLLLKLSIFFKYSCNRACFWFFFLFSLSFSHCLEFFFLCLHFLHLDFIYLDLFPNSSSSIHHPRSTEPFCQNLEIHLVTRYLSIYAVYQVESLIPLGF